MFTLKRFTPSTTIDTLENVRAGGTSIRRRPLKKMFPPVSFAEQVGRGQTVDDRRELVDRGILERRNLECATAISTRSTERCIGCVRKETKNTGRDRVIGRAKRAVN